MGVAEDEPGVDIPVGDPPRTSATEPVKRRENLGDRDERAAPVLLSKLAQVRNDEARGYVTLALGRGSVWDR